MARIIVTRLIQLVVVLVIVTFGSYVMLQLVPPAGHVERVLVPGDPHNPVVQQQQLHVRHDLGLDQSIFQQYWRWLTHFVHGNMGNYYRVSGTDPVSSHVSQAFPVTLELLIYSTILTLLIAVPLGVWTAYRAGRWSDRTVSAGSFLLLSIPQFAVGLLLSYYIGRRLGWLPPTGYTRPSDNLGQHIRSMILPTIALALGQIAVYQRLLRSDMVQTLQEDFILVAKAKGIRSQRVLWRHALRPSLLTVLTALGINLGALIGGALAIEIIFNLPGMGFLLAQAITQRQFVALQSLVAIIAVAYVIINFVVDILYRYLDPRIRDAPAAA